MNALSVVIFALVGILLAMAIVIFIPKTCTVARVEEGFQQDIITTCPRGTTSYTDSLGNINCCKGVVNGNVCEGKVTCTFTNNAGRELPMCNDPTMTQTMACPSGMELYGEYAGGFCCPAGQVQANRDGCRSTPCALDPIRTQGLSLCYAQKKSCPSGMELYGEYAGGFCCPTGQVQPNRDGCRSTPCALDSARSQGLSMCFK